MKYIFIGLVYALGTLLGLSLFMIGLSELISGDHPEGIMGHYMFVVSGMSISGLCVIGLAATTDDLFKHFKNEPRDRLVWAKPTKHQVLEWLRECPTREAHIKESKGSIRIVINYAEEY